MAYFPPYSGYQINSLINCERRKYTKHVRYSLCHQETQSLGGGYL